jgi:hypothetical protein
MLPSSARPGGGIAYCLLPIANCIQETLRYSAPSAGNFDVAKLPIAHCPLLIANCIQQTLRYSAPSAGNFDVAKLPIAHCPLPFAHCPKPIP